MEVSELGVVAAMVAKGFYTDLPTLHHASMSVLVGTVRGDNQEEAMKTEHVVGLQATHHALSGGGQEGEEEREHNNMVGHTT